MEYKDYYAIMGVGREATQDEIKRAYRRLARKYHPDVSKATDAEQRFKEVGEAYEVLKDPEKRSAYDQLGANWQSGQDFRPPPDWNAGFEFSGGEPDIDPAAFSDFFESLFGHDFRSVKSGGIHHGFNARGDDHHARVLIDIEDSYRGVTKSIGLRTPQVDSAGHVSAKERNLNVKIPKGIKQGQRIRLAGQGAPGTGGNKAGDLYLEIEFRENTRYRVQENDVYVELPVTPWEAALGAKIKIPTPGTPVELNIPANTSSGCRFRLKGKGIPAKTAGDLYVIPIITLPPVTTEKAKELYREMEQESAFNPREKLGV